MDIKLGKKNIHLGKEEALKAGRKTVLFVAGAGIGYLFNRYALDAPGMLDALQDQMQGRNAEIVHEFGRVAPNVAWAGVVGVATAYAKDWYRTTKEMMGLSDDTVDDHLKNEMS